MDINNKSVLVLGGWGLVGQSICRRLISELPGRIIACSLRREDADEMKKWLTAQADGTGIRVDSDWGDLFVRQEFTEKGRKELLENRETRNQLLDDMLGDLEPKRLKQTALYTLLNKHKPDIVIDCINTATAIAYQNIFKSAMKMREMVADARKGKGDPEELYDQVEKVLTSLDMPQLIRHIQILYESLSSAKVRMYVKIGTTGTGGMGFNIPYTHSEEKPSKMLLTKSAIAGAHTLLLFLMGRTPGATIVKEIKPATAIAWKEINHGKIKKGVHFVQLYDCTPEAGEKIDPSLPIREQGSWQELKGEFLESVYIDTGENGYFSLGEFEAITTMGQMEFITPEEIAERVTQEVKGINTGHDVIAALDAAILSPTYRAGNMRHVAIREMNDLEEETGTASVAFENLGPPRLSKLLYEAYMLKRLCGGIESLSSSEPAELSARMEKLIGEDRWVRSSVISIGIPVLMPDGKTLLRGPEIKTPGDDEDVVAPASPEQVENWCHRGWVDLRLSNMSKWVERAKKILEEVAQHEEGDSSSYYVRNRGFWLADGSFSIGRMVGWIFDREEMGQRMK